MTDDLLELALADPPRAWKAADSVLASSDSAVDLSVAHQARGIVLRDSGRMAEAIAELRLALRLAGRVDGNRAADVRATYGVALFVGGQTGPGLRALDRAAAEATEPVWETVLMRRAHVLANIGRWEAAESDLVLALDRMRGRSTPSWEARTCNHLGFVHLALGRIDEAEDEFARAIALFTQEGRDEEADQALGNLASAALARGDLPRALDRYARIQLDDVRDPWLRSGIVAEQCDAYLVAGLIAEAVELAGEHLRDVALPPTFRADLSLTLARVHRSRGDHDEALAAATEARSAFRRQKRSWLELRAGLVELQVRAAAGERRSLAARAREVARRLDEGRDDEAAAALVLAGRLAGGPERLQLWTAARRYRRHPHAGVRATAWLAAGLASHERGDRGGVLRACGRGLDALDEHRRTLGSSELRALSTAQGDELARLALKAAATEARALLTWSERWRATALAEPPVTPDEHLSAAVVALRDNGRRLAQARAESEPIEQLEAERKRLERTVRAEHHRRAADESAVAEGFDLKALLAEVGTGCLAELVDVDGTLHVIVVHDGKVRRRVAGTTEEALQLAAHARSAVRRAAHGRPFQPGDLGERLQEVLLGPAVDLIPDGPLVLSPTGRLHAVPWSMLPTLTDRPFSIVPSAAQWQRARAVPKPRRKKVVLLAAPGLGSGGSEVPKLVRRHQGATVLRGRKATVEAALAGLDRASLAHVAAHGRFRQDSPLFSSLEMADGSLSVYELERLRRAPYRLVLSACESGVLAPVGADELLGLASALFSMGTAGLVCSIAEVNDNATAALMVALHDHLLAHPEEGLAGALLAARRAAQGDPTREATAAAFLALGI